MVKNYFKSDTEQERSENFTKIFTNLVNKSEELFTFRSGNNIIGNVDNPDCYKDGGNRND